MGVDGLRQAIEQPTWHVPAAKQEVAIALAKPLGAGLRLR
jgi:hypothetical protein